MYKNNLKRVFYFLSILLFALLFFGCASLKAKKELNTNVEDLARGDPSNPVKAREFLLDVIGYPNGRTVKAYERRAFSPEKKKNLFVVHCFYVFYKDNVVEHTLVFTATPKGSELNGCWMLDAASDVDSYNLFSMPSSDNPWEVVEFQGPKGESDLNLLQTSQNIIERLDKGYKFFGPASVRNLPWYHHLWMALVPPPIIAWAPMLIVGIHKDNCTSAVLETMAWEK